MPETTAVTSHIESTLQNYDDVTAALLLEPAWAQDVAKALRVPCNVRQLMTQDCGKLPYRAGVWAYVDQNTPSAADSLVVLHWPLILQRLRQCLAYPSRQSIPMCVATLKRVREMLAEGDHALPALVEALAHRVHRNLPGGIQLPVPAALAEAFTKRGTVERDAFVAARIQEFSVLRFGPLSTYSETPLLHAFERFAPLTSKNLVNLDTRLLLHIPMGLRLLYLALTRATLEPPGAGFARWGMIWAKTQLFFNYRVALETAYADNDPPAYFEGLSKEDFQKVFFAVPDTRRSLRITGLPPFSNIYSVPAVDVARHHAMINSMLWVNHTHPTDMYLNKDNYVVFRALKRNSITEYFGALSRISAVHIEQLTAPKLPVASRTRKILRFSIEEAGGVPTIPELPPMPRPTVNVSYEPRVDFTLNANHLNYATEIENGYAPFCPMTLSTTKYRGALYLSLPAELVAHFPFLNQENHEFLREIGSWAPGAALLRFGAHFIHLDWLVQKSPIWNLLKTHLGTDEIQHLRYLKAFYRCVSWLHDPLSTPDVNRYEFSAATEDYPRRLQNLEDRFEFFRFKGKSLNKRNVLVEDKKGARSSRINIYDKFIFWYVAKWELDGETLHTPSNECHAEYITKRWMPWRTPKANLQYLNKLPSPRGSDCTQSPVVKVLLAAAKEKLETPFTQYVQRLTPLHPGQFYAHKEDVVLYGAD
jgi:hypothetical protein